MPSMLARPLMIDDPWGGWRGVGWMMLIVIMARLFDSEDGEPMRIKADDPRLE